MNRQIYGKNKCGWLAQNFISSKSVLGARDDLHLFEVPLVVEKTHCLALHCPPPASTNTGGQAAQNRWWHSLDKRAAQKTIFDTMIPIVCKKKSRATSFARRTLRLAIYVNVERLFNRKIYKHPTWSTPYRLSADAKRIQDRSMTSLGSTELCEQPEHTDRCAVMYWVGEGRGLFSLFCIYFAWWRPSMTTMRGPCRAQLLSFNSRQTIMGNVPSQPLGRLDDLGSKRRLNAKCCMKVSASMLHLSEGWGN